LGILAALGLGPVALGCASGVQDGGDGIGFGQPAPSGPATADGDGSGDDGSGTGDDGDGEEDGSGEGTVPTGSCEVGESESCYTGPADAAGVGACVEGTSSCEDGMWGPCTGEVLPGVETCNGIDDDCNGTVDDGVDSGGACSTGMPGVCADGTMTCSGGMGS